MAKKILRILRKKLIAFQLRRKVKNRDFCIICNNCWAGRVYQMIGVKYNTPTVGLFFHGPCYIKLVENLKYYLELKLRFIDTSSYESSNEARQSNPYPIGLLGDIEIHFLHYKDEEDARAKWEKRTSRINHKNLFLVISEIDGCTRKILERFENLNQTDKVAFTANEYKDLPNCVWIKDYQNFGIIGSDFTQSDYAFHYFDVAAWLDKKL